MTERGSHVWPPKSWSESTRSRACTPASQDRSRAGSLSSSTRLMVITTMPAGPQKADPNVLARGTMRGGTLMRRSIESLLPAAAILLAGVLVAACGQSGGGAIASLSPSRSASISVPSRSASISLPSPSTSTNAQPPATPSAIAPATNAPSTSSAVAGSGSSSSLIWLWIVIGILVLIGLIVGIARVRHRRSAAAAGWQDRVVELYAESAALCDSMRAAETPGALAAGDADARWSDIQRRADDLTRTLYALREAAPDQDERARISDVLVAVQGARAAMDAERGPGGGDGSSAQIVRSRLLAFEASVRALRAPEEPRF